MREQTHQKLPHERLDIYGVYLKTANLCADIEANAPCSIVALDHLDRAIESIGVNLMRGNGQPAGSAARANYLNIAEGHGRETVADQNRFMKTAQEHAYQTLLMLDLMAARNETTEHRIAEGKATQVRIITMLHAWCERNEHRNEQHL